MTKSPPELTLTARLPRLLHSRLATAAFAVALAACGGGGEDTGGGFGDGGFGDGSGGGGGGFGSGPQCDTDAECLQILRDQFNYDEVCTDIACVEGACVFDGEPLDGESCDDGDACTTGDACDNRRCRGEETVCADDEPCTADACDDETGDCTFVLTAGLICDDGIDCTETDRCDDAGGCAGTPTPSCQCLEDSHCAGLSSQNKCEGFFRCQADFSCEFDPTTVVDCGKLTTSCALGVCDPASGGCSAEATNEGGECDTSDNPCVQQGACVEGLCAGPPVECDDGDPCTEDTCSIAEGGCVFTPVDSGPCDDGNPCTQGDQCDQEGSCSGTPLLCDDANVCTAGTCDEATGDCEFEPVEGPCVHNDQCIVDEACLDGLCVGQPMDCDDGDVCTDDACKLNAQTSTASCQYDAHPDLEPCDDGDPCTAADFCQSGACTAGEQLCQCQTDEDCAVLEDGDPCTPAFVCNTGVLPTVCEEDPTSVPTCEPNEAPCLVNVCQSDTGECGVQDEVDGTGCDDGDACSTDGFCFEGSCASTPIPCEDGDKCTADLCFGGNCEHTGLTGSEVFLFADFDDGLPENWTTDSDGEAVQWTSSSSFDAGGSGKGMLVTGPGLEYSGPGTAELRSHWFGVYGEEISLRYHSRIEVEEPGCGADVLEVAVEAYGIDTPVQLLCQTASDWTEQIVDLTDWRNQFIRLVFTFRSNAASNTGFGAAVDDLQIVGTFSCQDDDACTVAEVCLAGQCVPEQMDCDDGDGCTADSCDPEGGCQHAPLEQCTCDVPADCPDPGACAEVDCVVGECVELALSGGCDDGSVCTTGDHCELAECVGDAVVCSDDDPCTLDECDPVVGCTFEPADGPCDDGDACTSDDACAEGECVGTPIDCQGSGECTTAVCVDGDCNVLPLHDGQLGFEADFDDGAPGGLPEGWQLETSDDGFGWQSVPGGAASEPNALTVVGPQDATWEALHVGATTPGVVVPAAGAELTFVVSTQFTDDSCGADTLTLKVDDEVVWTQCDDTVGWEPVSLSLAPSETPRPLTFAVDLAAGAMGSFEVRVDTVEVTEHHPCSLADPCVDGQCVVGSCVTEVVPGCE